MYNLQRTDKIVSNETFFVQWGLKIPDHGYKAFALIIKTIEQEFIKFFEYSNWIVYQYSRIVSVKKIGKFWEVADFKDFVTNGKV